MPGICTSLIPVVSRGTSAVAGSGRAPRNAAVPPSAVACRNSRRFMPSAPSSFRRGESCSRPRGPGGTARSSRRPPGPSPAGRWGGPPLTASLDDAVGAIEELVGDPEAQCGRGPPVDREDELPRPFDRELLGLGALEDLGDEPGGLNPLRVGVRAVGGERALLDTERRREDGGGPLRERQLEYPPRDRERAEGRRQETLRGAGPLPGALHGPRGARRAVQHGDPEPGRHGLRLLPR